MQSSLPTRALMLISEYSQPLTRADWRKGGSTSRQWAEEWRMSPEVLFGVRLICESQLYDKIVSSIAKYNNIDPFQCDYMPTMRVDVTKRRNMTKNDIEYMASSLICKSLKIEDIY